MDHLPMRKRFGALATGNTEEGSGSGCQATGRSDLNPVRSGSRAVGNRGEAAGSGSLDTGNIGNSFGKMGSKFGGGRNRRLRGCSV